MGNWGSTALHIHTQASVYETNGRISGEVCLKLKETVQTYSLALILKGQEHCEWEEVKVTQDRTTRTLHTGKAEALNLYYPLHFWPYSQARKGQYVFPFSFVVPEALPSSFSYVNQGVRAQIIYELQCVLEGTSLSTKIPLTLHSAQAVLTPLQTQVSPSVTGCCWLSGGQLRMQAYTLKAQYSAQSTLRALVEADSSQSTAKVTAFTCRLMRTVILRSNAGTIHRMSHFLHTGSVRIPCENTLLAARPQEYTVHLGSLRGLQNVWSTRGKRIECSYSLHMTPNLDSWCASLVDESSLSLPFLLAPEPAATPQPQFPADWQPQLMPAAELGPSAPPLEESNPGDE